MFCVNCGEELLDGANFCKKCGAKVLKSDQEEIQLVNKEEKSENNSKGLKSFIIIPPILFVLLISVLVLIYINKNCYTNYYELNEVLSYQVFEIIKQKEYSDYESYRIEENGWTYYEFYDVKIDSVKYDSLIIATDENNAIVSLFAVYTQSRSGLFEPTIEKYFNYFSSKNGKPRSITEEDGHFSYWWEWKDEHTQFHIHANKERDKNYTIFISRSFYNW